MATAAWTRKEGKSKSGGLNKKGVASYRKANPGSKGAPTKANFVRSAKTAKKPKKKK